MGITTAGRPRQTNKSQTMKLVPRVLVPSEVLFVNHESFILHLEFKWQIPEAESIIDVIDSGGVIELCQIVVCTSP